MAMCDDPTPIFGENRSPKPACKWVNAAWNQGYGRTKFIAAAGRPMIASTLAAPGHVVGYKCKRQWSPLGPPRSRPATAMSSMPRPQWTPTTGMRPTSAHRVVQEAQHTGWQGYSIPEPTRAAGISGPTSGGAWRPPSSSTRLFRPKDFGSSAGGSISPNVPPSIPRGYSGYVPASSFICGESPLRHAAQANPLLGLGARPMTSAGGPRPMTR